MKNKEIPSIPMINELPYIGWFSEAKLENQLKATVY
jgi:hypothetical protein